MEVNISNLHTHMNTLQNTNEPDFIYLKGFAQLSGRILCNASSVIDLATPENINNFVERFKYCQPEQLNKLSKLITYLTITFHEDTPTNTITFAGIKNYLEEIFFPKEMQNQEVAFILRICTAIHQSSPFNHIPSLDYTDYAKNTIERIGIIQEENELNKVKIELQSRNHSAILQDMIDYCKSPCNTGRLFNTHLQFNALTDTEPMSHGGIVNQLSMTDGGIVNQLSMTDGGIVYQRTMTHGIMIGDHLPLQGSQAHTQRPLINNTTQTNYYQTTHVSGMPYMTNPAAIPTNSKLENPIYKYLNSKESSSNAEYFQEAILENIKKAQAQIQATIDTDGKSSENKFDTIFVINPNNNVKENKIGVITITDSKDQSKNIEICLSDSISQEIFDPKSTDTDMSNINNWCLLKRETKTDGTIIYDMMLESSIIPLSKNPLTRKYINPKSDIINLKIEKSPKH